MASGKDMLLWRDFGADAASESGSDSSVGGSGTSESQWKCCVCCQTGIATFVGLSMDANIMRIPRIRKARNHHRRTRHGLTQNAVVAGACGDASHGVCVACVRAMVSARPGVRPGCVATNGPAGSYADGCPPSTRFRDRDLAVMIDRTEMEVIHAAERVSARCGRCGTPGVLDVRANLVRCAEGTASACGEATCFTCGAVTGGAPHMCRDDRGAWNHHYPARRGDGAPFLRNFEVTADVIARAVADVQADDRCRVACTTCGVMLEKTTDCNSLGHCGTEHCYACGFAALPGSSIPANHWEACLRYDTDERWQTEHGVREYLCVGGRCHDDARDCEHDAHRVGREGMVAARKRLRCAALRGRLPARDAIIKPSEAAVLAVMDVN